MVAPPRQTPLSLQPNGMIMARRDNFLGNDAAANAKRYRERAQALRATVLGDHPDSQKMILIYGAAAFDRLAYALEQEAATTAPIHASSLGLAGRFRRLRLLRARREQIALGGDTLGRDKETLLPWLSHTPPPPQR